MPVFQRGLAPRGNTGRAEAPGFTAGLRCACNERAHCELRSALNEADGTSLTKEVAGSMPVFQRGLAPRGNTAELKLLASLQAFAAPAMSELTASYARP